MNFPSQVFLTGFMGSGKSTIGPILANVLGYGFLDLDEAIEARLGTSIKAYFAQAGEAAFRDVETEVLLEMAQGQELVIALGGGALKAPQNLAQIRKTGVLVYLRLTAAGLLPRLMRSRKRPLLLDADGQVRAPDDLLHHIQTLLDARESAYLQADVVVDLEDHRIGTAVDAVVDALRDWARHSSQQPK